MNPIQIILLSLQFLISAAFILIVMSQATKNEGLGGPISDNMSKTFKGKPGREEQIQKLTLYLGGAWFAIGIVTGIAFRNFG